VSERRWLYGLTADEWFHLASEGEDSEVAPCCGNLGELRDLLRELAMFQSPYDSGWQDSIGRRVLVVVEADGDGHGLGDRGQYPLLHRVLDGIRAQVHGPGGGP
jgi:hypothetical protein